MQVLRALHSVPNAGRALKEKLGIKVVSPKMTELFHGIRSQLTTLLDGLDPKDLATMNLGLSHSLSRFVQDSLQNVQSRY